MRRAYYNKWSFHHGDDALPDVAPDQQLRMAVYSVPNTITTWTSPTPNESDTKQSEGKHSFKKSRRLLAILLVLFVIFLLAFTSTLIAWAVLSDGFENHKGSKDENGISDDSFFDGTSNSQNKICVSDDCAHVAGEIVRYFDKTVDPCDDFYQFACGKYPQEVPIPRDKDRTTTLDQIEHKTKMQLRNIFESPINSTEPASNRLVKQFYRLCMDVQAQQTWKLEPLRRAVGELGGWPNGVDSAWNESEYDWERTNAHLRYKFGVHALMIITVDADFKNNSKKMITIDQPDADDMNVVQAWKVAKARGTSALHSALDNMVDLALEFGASRDTVIADMEQILLFEILLGNISLPDERRRDRFKFYHPMSLADIRIQVPEINWDVLFTNLLPPEIHLSDSELIFNVVDLAYLKRLPQVLKRFSKKTLANYHIYYLAANYVRYLAPNFHDLHRPPFRRFLKSASASNVGLARCPVPPAPLKQDKYETDVLYFFRWEECVDETAALLYWKPVSDTDAIRNISVNAKGEVHQIFSYLRYAATNEIRHADWIDNTTSLAARVKLFHMALRIPDFIYTNNESTRVDLDYENLNVDNISYFDAAVHLNTLRSKEMFLSLRGPMKEDGSEDSLSAWVDPSTAASVNAFYRFDKNEVVLPTALLQPPLYSSQVPHYVQYSRLGALAAHELLHGYDEAGRQYDEYGNLRHWWTEQTLSKFSDRLDCLVEQYCNITDPISGHQLNGKLTVDENFADNGAIRLAWEAYLLWKEEQKVEDEARLPGLALYSTVQSFFLSFANVWCESVRPEAQALFIDEDEHALGKYRVNVPLQNFRIFSEAFNCPVGSPMNPVRKCQFW